MGETLPPLRIRENDGSPNLIPVYHIILSSNLTLENKGPGIVSISATTGAGGTSQDPITFPLIVGSGGTGIALAGSATALSGMNSSGVVYDYYSLVASDNLTIIRSGTGYFFSATTNAGAGGSGASTANTYVVTDFTTDLNSEFRLVQSGNSITVNTAGNLIIINAATGITQIVYAPTGGEYLTYQANATLTGERVIAASDNITIVSSGTSFLISATTGAGGSSVVYAATGNNYVVMNLAGDLTNEYRLVQSGNSITVTTDANTIVINAVTNGAGGGTQIISIPMALLTVEVNSGNAFWTAQTDTTRMDKAYVNMVDSGRSVSTWWAYVPRNVNATPAWGVDIIGEAAILGATGGFLVLNVDGMSVAVGESANTLAASTIQLVAATSFKLNTAGILSICTLTATNFDAVLATSATDYVKIKVARQGNADTFNSDWYIYSVLLNLTTNT